MSNGFEMSDYPKDFYQLNAYNFTEKKLKIDRCNFLYFCNPFNLSSNRKEREKNIDNLISLINKTDFIEKIIFIDCYKYSDFFEKYDVNSNKLKINIKMFESDSQTKVKHLDILKTVFILIDVFFCLDQRVHSNDKY